MRTWIAAGVVLAMWAPGIWLEGYFSDMYGSIGRAPVMGQIIALGLMVLPWYVILGNDGKYMTALERLFGIDKDE